MNFKSIVWFIKAISYFVLLISYFVLLMGVQGKKQNKGLYDLQKNSYQLVSVPVIILSHPPSPSCMLTNLKQIDS